MPSDPNPPIEPFSIRNRWTGEVITTVEIPTGLDVQGKLGEAVLWATKRNSDLRGADLRGANLSGADLRDMILRDANLRGADLRGADLRDTDLLGANLGSADLRGADLRDANLRGANLGCAILSDADLRGADMRDAILRDADLRGADLGSADMRSIRADLYDVLVANRAEAPAFLAALRAGKVAGSSYSGECACLVGTIANARGVPYVDVVGKDSKRPIERFLLNVEIGDTPENNQVARLVAEWTVAFIGEPP